MQNWRRDLDTIIRLQDPAGNVVQNDDFRKFNDISTFSGIEAYVLQGSGRVYVEVLSFYSERNNQTPSPGYNDTGLYRIYMKSSAGASVLTESEPNNSFASAFPLPDGKAVLAIFSTTQDIDMILISSLYPMITYTY